MAIIRQNYQDTLRMRYDFGPDPEEPHRRIRRARSYTRGKHTAADEQFHAMARAMAKLYDVDLVQTYRVMHVELIEEP